MKNEVSPEWIQYMKRIRAYRFACYGYIPFMVVLLFVSGRFGAGLWHLDQQEIMIVGFFVYGAACVAASLRLMIWPCPRCRESYFFKGAWGNLFRQKCAHCGLERFSDPGSVRM